MDDAISLQDGHTGYFFGSRPGTQVFPHSATTGVALTIPSTTEFPVATNSSSLSVNPSSTMWVKRS